MGHNVILRDSFLASAFELPKEIAKKVFKALHLFVRDRQHPGLHVEKLSGTDRVWSLRVDQRYRVIFTEQAGAIVLVFVGKHDDSYSRGILASSVNMHIAPALAYEPIDTAMSSPPGTGQSSTPAGIEDIETLIRTRKYLPLARYLLGQTGDTVTLGFGKVEQLIADHLPASARRYRPWWANSTSRHSQAAGWLAVGWEVAMVDLAHETVGFRRLSGNSSTPAREHSKALSRAAR